MDYKSNVFTSLCHEIETAAEYKPVAFIVQDMMWDGLREEVVVVEGGKRYSRVVNDDGEAMVKWMEVKNQEVK